MDRVLLLIIIAAIIGVGLFAGGASLGLGVASQGQDDWSPRDYVSDPGNPCFVAAKGDPLYDAHYAQEVNPGNCNAYMVQEQAGYVGAQTDAVKFQTQEARYGVYSILFVVGAILLLGLVLVLKGGAG